MGNVKGAKECGHGSADSGSVQILGHRGGGAFWCCCGFWGNVILPFVVGGAIAYFLDPVADRLERLGLSRVVATTVISLVALLVVVLLVLAVIPTLVDQLTALINAAPEIARSLQELSDRAFPRAGRQHLDRRARRCARSARRSSRGAASWRRRLVGLGAERDLGAWSSSSWCRWWRSTCCWTGTTWSPGSTRCCRATMRR